MYARIKRSGGSEYLQIVEARRRDGKPRQELVMYVGRYGSVAEALKHMPKERASFRSRATRQRNLLNDCYGSEVLRRLHGVWYEKDKAALERYEREIQKLSGKLERLQALVEEHPELARIDQR